MKKYEVLKTISLSNINEINPCADGFAAVVAFATKVNTKADSTVNWFGSITEGRLNDIMQHSNWESTWTAWLINNGFIKEINQKIYFEHTAYFLVPDRSGWSVLQVRKTLKDKYRLICLNNPYDNSYHHASFDTLEGCINFALDGGYPTYKLVEMPLGDVPRNLGFKY